MRKRSLAIDPILAKQTKSIIALALRNHPRQNEGERQTFLLKRRGTSLPIVVGEAGAKKCRLGHHKHLPKPVLSCRNGPRVPARMKIMRKCSAAVSLQALRLVSSGLILLSRMRSTRWARTAAGRRDHVSICGIIPQRRSGPTRPPSA